ncbi:hypothetical protein WJ32_26280 [Burkholderia ubonensis]|uniref:Uncharacterized protein n=1 Tax=Burkholderia ubonensis TaxID=101571 RepID=A0A118HJH3_9BURK|nr:hypothetical protein WJ32_26280 [Burkholderia ubonensis]KVG53103.1 hypothetical protein WJ33_08240 [Burkholderia ubonensis]
MFQNQAVVNPAAIIAGGCLLTDIAGQFHGLAFIDDLGDESRRRNRPCLWQARNDDEQNAEKRYQDFRFQFLEHDFLREADCRAGRDTSSSGTVCASMHRSCHTRVTE